MADISGQFDGRTLLLRGFASDAFGRRRIEMVAEVLDFGISSFGPMDDAEWRTGAKAIVIRVYRRFRVEMNRHHCEHPPGEVCGCVDDLSNQAEDRTVFDLYHWRCASEMYQGVSNSGKGIPSRRRILFLDEADILDASSLELRHVMRAILCADVVISSGNVAKVLPGWVIGAIDVTLNLPTMETYWADAGPGRNEYGVESMAWVRRQWFIATQACFRDPTDGNPGTSRVGWLFVTPEHYIVHLMRSARYGMVHAPVNGFQRRGPIRALLEGIARRRLDVLVIHGWGTATALGVMLLAKCRGIPYLIVSDTFRRGGERSVWYQVTTRMLRKKAITGAACLMPAGVPQAEYMQTALGPGAAMPRIVLARFGVDVPRLGAQVAAVPKDVRKETRRAWGVESDQIVALFLGKLMAYKGADRLPEIARRVNGAEGSIRFVVLGSGPMMDQLKNAVRDGARLRLLGAKYGIDVIVALAAADLLILPSREEQWGLVVNEAMAASIPAVVTDGVGSATDLIENGNAGIVCNNDERSISEAVLRLADDVELREELGTCGKKHVQDWSVQAMVRAVIVGCGVALEK
jgi:1,2-diacylglycerol 3-alpha-glucosyltransferase